MLQSEQEFLYAILHHYFQMHEYYRQAYQEKW